MTQKGKGPKSGNLDEAAILARISGGETITEIALSLKMSRPLLCAWLDGDPDRSARARDARTRAAAAWDEKAEITIASASDGFELSKAKELAHHYRWRSSKIAPREYGDKVDVNHGGSLKVSLEVSDGGLL